MTASRAGTFLVRFVGMPFDRCDGLVAVATRRPRQLRDRTSCRGRPARPAASRPRRRVAPAACARARRPAARVSLPSKPFASTEAVAFSSASRRGRSGRQSARCPGCRWRRSSRRRAPARLDRRGGPRWGSTGHPSELVARAVGLSNTSAFDSMTSGPRVVRRARPAVAGLPAALPAETGRAARSARTGLIRANLAALVEAHEDPREVGRLQHHVLQLGAVDRRRSRPPCSRRQDEDERGQGDESAQHGRG